MDVLVRKNIGILWEKNHLAIRSLVYLSLLLT